MKKLTMFALSIATIIFMVSAHINVKTVKADSKVELFRTKATAYCLTGKTASGAYTTEGRTVASKPEWIGSTMIVWLDDGDGRIKDENYLGTYEVQDTGGENVKNGKVIDIYNGCYEWCINFGTKNVIVEVIKSEG